MCIIKIFKQGLLKPEEVDYLWEQNPDGGGIGLINKKLNLEIPIKTNNLEKFKTVLFKHLEKAQFETLVFHLRKRSRGSLDKININPIFINKSTVMFHNGTFDEFNNNFYSDTFLFVFNIIQKINNFDIENKTHIDQIKSFMSDNLSRVVFLQVGKPEPLIIDNFEKGYWNIGGEQWSSK